MPDTKDYCQYLLSSHINYTQTYYADHVAGLSHDRINRYLSGAKLRPSHLWRQVKSDIIQSCNGFIIFDDTVLDKRHSHKIEPVRLQYSGNAHGLIKGIGVVTCVYCNPDTDQFWAIDYRIYDPDKDGKSKLDHMKEILKNVHYHKELEYLCVLMDSWYATKDMMLFIHEDLQKIFYLRWSQKTEQSVKVYPIIDSETNYDEETSLYISFQEEGCSCGFAGRQDHSGPCRPL